MKRAETIKIKSGKKIASMALKVGVASTHTACFAVFHQPKIPHSMKKYVFVLQDESS